MGDIEIGGNTYGEALLDTCKYCFRGGVIKWGDRFGKVIILTFSDKEEHIIEKIMAALTEDTVAQSAEIPVQEDLRFGNLKISPSQRIVLLNGIEIPLTTREFDVLYFMASHTGQVFTMKQLYECTIHEPYNETFHILTSAIYRIRKKIGANCIQNIYGYGYKFEWNPT